MKLLTTTFATVVLALPLHAAAQQWVNVGPESTSVHALLVRAGDELLVGSSGGVLRSSDGGAHWTTLRNGLPLGRVTALASPASQPQVLYASVEDRGIYKSTNNGATWTAVNNGLPRPTNTFTDGAYPTMRKLIVDPGNAAAVYGVSFSGLFKTIDAGATWTMIRSGGAVDLAIDPQSTQTVYLLTGSGGPIWRSTNAGASFSPISASGFSLLARQLLIDPITPSVLYVLDPTCGFDGCVSLAKSVDGGVNFEPVTTVANFPDESVMSVQIDPLNHETLYAGTDCEGVACPVYKSTNGGVTWSPSATHFTQASITELAVDPSSSSVVYAGAACPVTSGSGDVGPCGGIARSINGGASWAVVSSAGVFNAHITTLEPHPVNTSVIYAGTMNLGLFKSTDRGATWTAANSGLTNLNILALAIETPPPHRVYVATWDGIFRSGADGGGGFTPLHDGLATAGSIRSIASHRINPGVMYACGDFDGGLYKLTGGTTWSEMRSEACSLVATDPVNAETVYVASGPIYQLFKSTDGGATFPTALGPGDPGVEGPFEGVSSLAIDPTNPAIMWATGHRGGGATPGNGVFRSADSGATWTRLGGPGVQFGGLIVLDRVTPSRAYVTGHAGTYILTEAGARWSPLPHLTIGGLGQFRAPSALAALGGASSRVLIGTTATSAWWMNPPAPPAGAPACSYQLSYRGGFSFPAAGGSNSVTVTAPDGCSWGLAPSFFDSRIYESTFNTWTRSGTGTLSFGVVPNTGASLGNWLRIAGHYLGFTIAAPGCTFSLSTTEQSIASGAGGGNVAVTTTAGCQWTGGSTSAWLLPWSSTTSLPSIPAGSGSFHYTVDANPTTSPRVATVNVAGRTLTVTQAGTCMPTLNPTSTTIDGAGGNGSVMITAPAGCSWGVAIDASWIQGTTSSTGVGNGTFQFSAFRNGTNATRTGTLTINGATFTVTQPPDPGCVITPSPTSATVGSAGTIGLTISVAAPQNCVYTVSNLESIPWVTLTSGQGFASGPRTIVYNVAANASTLRVGTFSIGGVPFQVTQSGTTSTEISLDPSVLRFGAVTNGASFVSQTAAQVVRMTQAGAAVPWTATATVPWLHVSPGSGSGSASLTISIAHVPGVPTSGTVIGAITLAFPSPQPTRVVNVFLTLVPVGTESNPFGFVDTPINNATGVTGAVPFTGWALDDLEVTNVSICRAAVPGETASVDPNCGGMAQIFVGFAVFIDGARPDVATAYPGYPRNTRAGWGFMVLTNMLPDQTSGRPSGGNGLFQFFAWARDRENHVVSLGTRTLTITNASATRPFGAIDTPTQGGTASGSSFVNFGWALTQAGKMIPIDGSSITVLVDGAAVGSPSYNHFRSDIAALFPGLANSNGAIGFRILDTTTLANGLHTISWVVTDSNGATQGIGSRFFTVANGVSAITAPARNGAAAIDSNAAIATAPRDDSPILARRGWNLEVPWRYYVVGRSGRAVIRGEEIDRFEVRLDAQPDATYTGHLRVGNDMRPLPPGAQLQPSGAFTWAPGVGFVGPYDFVFVRWTDGRAVARHELRVILAPKGSGHVGTQVTIDAPRADQTIAQPFHLGGWAADVDAATGTGIDVLHVWAYPTAGGPPVFLGTPQLGGTRPDVGAVHGDQFGNAGFGMTIAGLPAGTYDLAVFAWSNVVNAFAPPAVVRVKVQ